MPVPQQMSGASLDAPSSSTGAACKPAEQQEQEQSSTQHSPQDAGKGTNGEGDGETEERRTPCAFYLRTGTCAYVSSILRAVQARVGWDM